MLRMYNRILIHNYRYMFEVCMYVGIYTRRACINCVNWLYYIVYGSLGIVLSFTQHAQMAIPLYKVTSALTSVIKKNAKVPTTNLGIYSNRYLCIRDNFITMRGVIMKPNDALATAVRDTLRTWLGEQGSSLLLGDRQVGIRAGLCGLALSTVNDPVCGRDYPALSSRPPPNTSPSQNTQSASPSTQSASPSTQSASSSTQSASGGSSRDEEVESLKISLVSVCFVSGGLVIVIAILVVYTLYRRRRSKR